MESFNKEDRQKRLQFLRRQEERRRALPQLLQNLSHISGKRVVETEVLSLEEIDLHNINLNGTDFGFNYINLSFPKDNIDRLTSTLESLSEYLNTNNYLTLSKWSELIVIKCSTNFVIDNIISLLELDKNTITVHDLKYKNGFWIDLAEEYWYSDGKAELTPIYELRVFGKEWMRSIAKSL